MSWARKSLLILVALMWGPVTAHCSLEALPGFSFLACSEADESGSHQDSGCDRDSCATLEAGFFLHKKDRADVSMAVPDIAELLCSVAQDPADASALFPPRSEPDLTPARQFRLRTASHPRAP